MRRLTVNGPDSIIDNFAELAKLPDSAIVDILNSEVDVIVQAQWTEIEIHWKGPQGAALLGNFGKKGKVKKGLNGRYITVYPQGSRKRDGHSIRNAEIAFINEYGAHGRHIAARTATNTANAKKENKAIDAGEKVYHDYLDSKKIIILQEL